MRIFSLILLLPLVVSGQPYQGNYPYHGKNGPYGTNSGGSGPTPPTVIAANDTFVRADADPISSPMSDTIGIWTNFSARWDTLRVAGNAATKTVAGLPTGASIVFYPSFGSNQTATITLGANMSHTVGVRGQTNSGSGYKLTTFSSTRLAVYRTDDNGSIISDNLLSFDDPGPTFSAGDTITLVISNTTLTAKYNGFVVPGMTTTDSTYHSGQPWISEQTLSTITHFGGNLEQPFNIGAAKTRLIPVGDSITANAGQPCWVPTYTNLFGVNFQFITNAAHNGAYLDSSGSIMDFYDTEVKVWKNTGFVNVIPLLIGANNDLSPVGEHTNFITDYITYVTRATNDGFHVVGLTILPNWRSTNATFGTQYEIERAACNAFIMTNTIVQHHVNLDLLFPVSSVTNGVLFGDVPPLHPSNLGVAIIGTNVFKATTTN